MSAPIVSRIIHRSKRVATISIFPFYMVFVALPYAVYWGYREAIYGERSPIKKVVEKIEE